VNGVYLYCIASAARKPSPARSPHGLPGATPPEIVPAWSSVWLVLAEVPLDTYSAGRIEEQLGDLDWVGRIALAHEEVVEHFARRPGVSVVPMKLFTMFSNRARAIAEITARRKVIEDTVSRIAGAEEWGIRVTRTTAATAGSAAGVPLGPERSGAAFLAAKKHARDAARDAKLAAAESAIDAYDRLSSLSRESRRRTDTPASAATPPLLDAAFLVPSGKRAQFKAAAQREAARCAKAGAQMTLSGPWPAYNFVERGEAEAG
jgi:hypothetical protein